MRDITPRDIIIEMVPGARIEVMDIRISGVTTTDRVIGIDSFKS